MAGTASSPIEDDAERQNSPDMDGESTQTGAKRIGETTKRTHDGILKGQGRLAVLPLDSELRLIRRRHRSTEASADRNVLFDCDTLQWKERR